MIKFFRDPDINKLEEEVNNFLKEHKYIDLKMFETDKFYIFCIIYE